MPLEDLLPIDLEQLGKITELLYSYGPYALGALLFLVALSLIFTYSSRARLFFGIFSLVCAAIVLGLAVFDWQMRTRLGIEIRAKTRDEENKILDAARSRATEIEAKASQEASRKRAEADAILAAAQQKQELSEAELRSIRKRANDEAEKMISSAHQEVVRIREQLSDAHIRIVARFQLYQDSGMKLARVEPGRSNVLQVFQTMTPNNDGVVNIVIIANSPRNLSNTELQIHLYFHVRDEMESAVNSIPLPFCMEALQRTDYLQLKRGEVHGELQPRPRLVGIRGVNEVNGRCEN